MHDVETLSVHLVESIVTYMRWCLRRCDVCCDVVYDDVMMCYKVYDYEIDSWLLVLTFDLYANIIVVNLTPSAGIAASWASAGTQS